MAADLGGGYEKSIIDLFHKEARLYILMIAGEIGSIIWVRSGRDIGRWMIPLSPADYVMFAGYTSPKFRGMHLHGHVIAAAFEEECKAGGQCFADCNVSNLPSKRQLERTGFSVILKAKHVSDDLPREPE
jgi:hypothetical protein